MRQSKYVPHRAAANLTRAVTFAQKIGRPLDTLVSINYGLTFTNEEDMTAAFRRLLKSFFGKWFVRHPMHRRSRRGAADRALTYVWVAEGRAGHHGIHWLVYIPSDMKAAFARELPRWLEKTAGSLLEPKAVRIDIAWRPQGAADYMLKGLHPAHARRFGVKHRFQGVVFGKRCAVSENLGPKAIARHTQAQAEVQANSEAG